MKSILSKEKFIELRAQGLSYESISKELGVSKPTLIKWDRECADSIANVLYFNIENLLERYRLVKKFRIEALSSALSKALREMEDRDFSNVPTKDLLLIIHTLEGKLKKEITGIQYHTGDVESRYDLDMELVKEKTVPMKGVGERGR